MLGFHRIAPVKAARDPERADGCSFPEMQQLGAAVKQCLGRGDRCEHCCNIERYLSDLWAQPHLVRLSWYGTSRMNPRVLDQVLEVLGAFVKQIRSAKLPQCDAHLQYAAIVEAFCQQRSLVL